MVLGPNAMNSRIIRGVRVALPTGIMPASVHIDRGRIVALAGYDEVPREACPEELGKSVLMPAMTPLPADELQLPIGAQVTRMARRLADRWTSMREQGLPIEQVIDLLCQSQLQVGASADFFVWNPELVVIDSRPVRYGQLRQISVAGLCTYKDGVHFSG